MLLERFRPCYQWCGIGFVAAAIVGAMLVGLTRAGWIHALLFAPGLGLIGAAFAFIAATFYYAIRETGCGPIARRALAGAVSAVVIALVLHLLGTSLAGSLAADLTVGPVMLGFTAAYFRAVEFWVRQRHERTVGANHRAGA